MFVSVKFKNRARSVLICSSALFPPVSIEKHIPKFQGYSKDVFLCRVISDGENYEMK